MRKFLLLLLLSANVFAQPVIPVFRNVTTSAIDQAVKVEFHMGVFMADLTGDGCLDLFSGSHNDSDKPSAQYTQDCKGKFKLNQDRLNYSQSVPPKPRITAGHLAANFTGNADGLPSITGQDADNDRTGTALYPILRVGADGNPVYGPKVFGCRRSSCVPIDYNDDGQVDLLTAGGIHSLSGTLLVDLSAADSFGSMLNFDVNGDTYLDFAYPNMRAVRLYNPETLQFDWHHDSFDVTDMHVNASSRHMVVLDIDRDNDLDLWVGVATYSENISSTVQGVVLGPNIFRTYVFRNDNGYFTDITAEAGFGVLDTLKNTTSFTAYAASMAADLNNDGFKDIMFCAETGQHKPTTTGTAIPLLLNDGNSHFDVDRSNDFEVFAPASSVNGGSRPRCGYGDYDSDGDIDIVKTAGNSGCEQNVINCQHTSIALWENVTNAGNHWLTVRAQSKTSDGFGTTITVTDSDNGETVGYDQVIVSQAGFSNLIPHFGLGTRTKVDVEVAFPNDGPVYTYKGVAADQTIIVRLNGDIVEGYQPGINPLKAVATGGAVPPDEESSPVEERPVDPPTESVDPISH